jgi:uncharacterized caspase-like protein
MAKHALCVGINTYPDGNNLNGCLNDANAWAALLTQHFGFPQANVKLLLEAQATKANIMAGLESLLAGARPGDVLVFTNSSHGTYVADKSGDEAYDEAICPYDCDKGVKYLVLDDELRKLFGAKLKAGVSMTVISDSCHSGSLTRAVVGEGPDNRRARFLNPKVIGLRELPDADAAKSRRVSAYSQADMKEVLLSGCSPREYSWDATIGGKPHGAMSWYALKAIRDSGYDLTWDQLGKQVRSQLEVAGFKQHPQLEGTPANKKKPIFT